MFEIINRALPANKASQRVVLIDGDIIKYRNGFAAETKLYNLYHPPGNKVPLSFEGKRALNSYIEEHNLDPDILYWEEQTIPDKVENTLHSVKITIESIVKSTQADRYVIYLSCKGNFRDEIAKQKGYKENRKDLKKPYHYQNIHDYLVKYQNLRS